MKILVNGRAAETDETTTLQELLLSYRLTLEGVIVELNEQVMRRDKWAETRLCEGDRLELVSLVGGG